MEKTETSMSMEEELVRLIKRVVDERVHDHGVILFDVEKANDLAVELGLDVSCVKAVIQELNRLLEEKFRDRKRDNLP
jgi:hypothetical protein